MSNSVTEVNQHGVERALHCEEARSSGSICTAGRRCEVLERGGINTKSYAGRWPGWPDGSHNGGNDQSSSIPDDARSGLGEDRRASDKICLVAINIKNL
ncbi:hypothetical protein CTA1_7392 [Colletotrichum tanaceti]|uniref:Uncharacterized protein n=1 Tax=Colletotrichum tanaceti TaxID=1306861 RepID=A0A4U6X1P4_9PEZI|nr:hypothetical protein CTA1_7392 [Colletotrichum tanaceti]